MKLPWPILLCVAAMVGMVAGVIVVVAAALIGHWTAEPEPEPTSAIATSTHQLRDGTTVECITWYADASDEESAERECFITGQLPTLPE